MNLDLKMKQHVRDIPDFPKPGIVFKDITPIFSDPAFCREIIDFIVAETVGMQLDAVLGIESRGFLFGILLAQKMNIPFIPIRKKGKLPYETIEESYQLEYGEACIEMHIDALKKGDKVMIHDDLLATGGTVGAACRLVEQLGAQVEACSFLIDLAFLNGRSAIRPYTDKVICLSAYE